ncbi:CLUMA_CG005359, isoform A [Clunio marinus]|uniref:CLUMA_CG005359, isoform A n=1 Tax=Clunio marinus TaxID=568069 RepID=A0A1J1HUH3_9DIPT|nr:CLUMA_CG005359, isoform A [Clunio marinus]
MDAKDVNKVKVFILSETKLKVLNIWNECYNDEVPSLSPYQQAMFNLIKLNGISGLSHSPTMFVFMFTSFALQTHESN